VVSEAEGDEVQMTCIFHIHKAGGRPRLSSQGDSNDGSRSIMVIAEIRGATLVGLEWIWGPIETHWFVGLSTGRLHGIRT
jgi:hypothetical protein